MMEYGVGHIARIGETRNTYILSGYSSSGLPSWVKEILGMVVRKWGYYCSV
jgi:hypothetical protein